MGHYFSDGVKKSNFCGKSLITLTILTADPFLFGWVKLNLIPLIG